MLSGAEELERFKCEIDLVEFAASQGYTLDRKASYRGEAVMMGPGGDKVSILRNNPKGYWTYLSRSDHSDNGTIINFVQNRQHCNLGEVRKILRPWIGQGADPLRRVEVQDYTPELMTPTATLNREQLTQSLAAMPVMTRSVYLEGRNIPADLLASQRLVGKIYQDPRGNVIFPHYNLGGLCGYEKKNAGFTGFAEGGRKGLWASRVVSYDTTAVIAETAIDAISYLALHPDPHTRLFSIAGTMSDDQLELVRRATLKLPDGGLVILAVDNDAGGDTLYGVLSEVLEQVSPKRSYQRHSPLERGQDWNEVLKAGSAPEASVFPSCP